MSKKVGIIGSGGVGKALASGFAKHGYSVMIGSNSTQKREELKNEMGVTIKVGKFAEAAAFGDIIVFAVKGTSAEQTLSGINLSDLNGKTIIDTTNPISDVPPTNSVLHFFTTFDESLMERLQAAAPEAHFVKCFSCVGSYAMVNPTFSGGKPTMFICGNEDKAKAEVKPILEQFGWECEDMGGIEAARAIEPLCILWCIRGFKENQWVHAFKLLK